MENVKYARVCSLDYVKELLIAPMANGRWQLF